MRRVSTPARRYPSGSERRTPSTYSMASTRAVLSPGCTAGMASERSARKLRRNSSMVRASYWKSSSRVSTLAKWSIRGTSRKARSRGRARSSRSARSIRMARSAWISSSIPGRWILRASCSPSRDTARWTWAMEALAKGCGSKLAKRLAPFRPQLPDQHRLQALEGQGGRPVLQLLQLRGDLVGQQVGAQAQELAELDEGGSQLLEQQAQAGAGAQAPQAPRRRPGQPAAAAAAPRPAPRSRRTPGG